MFQPFVSQLTLDVQTWISKESYNKIVQVESVLANSSFNLPPIFVFYKIDPNLVSYYSNIVGMIVGQHYTYYGNLQFLVAGLPTPVEFLINNQGEIQQANLLFQQLKTLGVSTAINAYPIVLLTPDFYAENVSSLKALQKFSYSGGFFVIPPRNDTTQSNLLSTLVICYTDYLNFSGSMYAAKYNNTIAPFVLEHYSDNPENSEFWVSFPVFVYQNYSCTLDVRMFDAASNWSPVQFYLDENLMLVYNYTGSGSYVDVVMQVPKGLTGLNILKLATSGEKQIIRLDIITVSFASSSGKSQ
jgi:hypothetical protein